MNGRLVVVCPDLVESRWGVVSPSRMELERAAVYGQLESMKPAVRESEYRRELPRIQKGHLNQGETAAYLHWLNVDGYVSDDVLMQIVSRHHFLKIVECGISASCLI